jgi:hypothetical protein
LSHQWYEFLKRSGCVKKGMAVWDNTASRLVTANQKSVVSGDITLAVSVSQFASVAITAEVFD